MQSVVFPLNRQHNSACLVQQLAQPDSLKLFDLGSPTMFGVFQDSRHFAVKQFVRGKDGCLNMLPISSTDFGLAYGMPKNVPLITEIVPLNRYDSILITLENKRYLVYNYLSGDVVKEILPLRGSQFKACSDWQFDLKTQPWIILYNTNSIRRVDIQTFEVKKNIDMSRISGNRFGGLTGPKQSHYGGGQMPSLQKQANEYKFNKTGNGKAMNGGHFGGYQQHRN